MLIGVYGKSKGEFFPWICVSIWNGAKLDKHGVAQLYEKIGNERSSLKSKSIPALQKTSLLFVEMQDTVS